MPAIKHPNDELLASVLTGQLSQPELERVLDHLCGCSDCDRRLDELDVPLRKYREHCARIEERLRVCDWPEIQAAMDDADRGSRAITELRPRTKIARSSSRFAWYGAVAAAALLCALLIWTHGSSRPELRADVLLEKARRSAPIPSARARLRVSTRRGSFLRPAVWRAGASELNAEGLRMKFEAAHYNWSDPLNPASYSDWRDRLGERKDSVSVGRNASTGQLERYSIRTTTPDSALREATVTLVVPALSATSARFVFADQDWVEVTRIADGVEEVAPRIDPISPPTASTAAPVSPPAEQPVTEREFRVRAAIDQLQADVGTPINVEVQRGGEIVVTPYHLPEQQERTLEARLAGISGITVRQPDADAAAPAAPRSSGPADLILNASETILSRASLLSQLAERFPPSKEMDLTASEREQLWGMRVRHARQMSQDVETLARLLAGTRPAAAGGAVREAPAADGSFSMVALVESASSVDHLITTLLTMGDASVGPVPAWPQLTEAIDRLRQLTHTYQSLAERRQEELR